jgi:regulator of protease activity HflC (stomatin/prohibitin superfamily)
MKIQHLILAFFTIVLGACQTYRDIPPNDIAMILTPSGYEDKIYSPGQVDIGETGRGGSGNRLVLIQRSGLEVKEAFINNETAKEAEDRGDHRCLTLDKAPLALDVRANFALPDYEKPEGKKDLERIFHLGNPIAEGNTERVSRISAQSIYSEQARQSVRGKIRQICSGYKNFDDIFAAVADESEKGLTKKIEHAIATVLKDRNIPIKLVNAYPSNIKPDPSVIDAIAAQQAAAKRVEAITTITSFLDADKTGSRRMVYQYQVIQEIVARANANGHNTIILGPGGSLPSVTSVSPR